MYQYNIKYDVILHATFLESPFNLIPHCSMKIFYTYLEELPANHKRSNLGHNLEDVQPSKKQWFGMENNSLCFLYNIFLIFFLFYRPVVSNIYLFFPARS